ncbi:MAG: HlyD family efflux transporter periplasmic adaptor subunit, partial [Betaproteobacteria bacterium]
SLAAAAHQLVSQLALLGHFDRVALAFHEHGKTWLLASSSADLASTDAAPTQTLLGAIDEAIDQGVPLCWPVPDAKDTDPSADWIRLEHRQWQQLVGGAVASLPLGTDGTVYAAVSVQRDGTALITDDQMRQLEQWLSLAAPALRWMRHGEEAWHLRMRRGLAQAMSDLRQPRRRSTRLLLLAAVLAVAFITLVPLEYSVSGRARVEGAQQRVLSAPSDGFIKTAHVRPGDRVKAGAPLVDLIEEDLQLEQDRWRSQLAQYENAYAAAMAKSDRVGASTSFERVNEAQAQLALITQQRTRGRIIAPFDALVVQGDLSQSIGAPVRQGDALLTLASTDQYRVVVDIDETDIAQVHPGQVGQLALSSLPWQDQDLRIERITPLARAVEGRNVFEVQAQLTQAPDALRPGLIGRADIVVGRMPPLWAWSRHALMRIRLAWWSWIG